MASKLKLIYQSQGGRAYTFYINQCIFTFSESDCKEKLLEILAPLNSLLYGDQFVDILIGNTRIVYCPHSKELQFHDSTTTTAIAYSKTMTYLIKKFYQDMCSLLVSNYKLRENKKQIETRLTDIFFARPDLSGDKLLKIFI